MGLDVIIYMEMIRVKKNILIVVLIFLLLVVSGILVFGLIGNEEDVLDNNNYDGIIYNNYDLFVDNFDENYTKFDSNNYISQFIASENIEGGYNVRIDLNKKLYIKYIDEDIARKFGEYLIAENVLYFNVISTGHDLVNTLYFINEDGTVGSAEIERGILAGSAKIDVINDLGYRDIVAVIGGSFGDGLTSMTGAIFVDINGKFYSNNLR